MNWLIIQIIILIALAVIIGLFKNYYIIIGSIIAVTVYFIIIKKSKRSVLLIAIFGVSLLISTLVSEFTDIDLSLLFFPLAKIYPIYPDTPNGEYYRFNNKNPNDLKQVNEIKNEEVFSKRNQDGSWKVGKGTTRIDIFTKQAGIIPQEQMMKQIKTWNFSQLDKQGYWLYPSDWKNIEFTAIFKILEAKEPKQAISIVTRSVRHDSKGEDEIKEYPNAYCGGSSYHNNISLNGIITNEKRTISCQLCSR